MLTLHPSGEQRFGEWDRRASCDDLNPAARALSFGPDPTCARLAASHRVQQSSSSDSVLTVGLAARRHQRTPVLRANGAARLPLGLLSDLSASISLSAQLQQLHTWNRFNIFQVERLTQGRPLYTVTLAIMDALGLLSGWKLDRRRVEAFLTAAEQAYGTTNPYHNSTHAADVVHATFILLRSVRQPQFTKLEVFALLLSAVVHDVAHPGVTNDFLRKTSHPFAAAHGTHGTNEKHHVSTTFSIISHASTDVLSGLSPAEALQVRDFVESAVMYTDMTQHNDLLERLQAAKPVLCSSRATRQSALSNEPQQAPTAAPTAAMQRAALASRRSDPQVGAGTGWDPQYRSSGDGAPSATAAQQPEVVAAERNARQTLLYSLLHAADLSNPARPLPIGSEWGHLVAREFMAQGDCEKRKGLSVTPFCDREQAVVSTNQLKFIDMFLRPLLSDLEGLVGDDLMELLLRNLSATVEYWQQQEAHALDGEPVDS